MDAIRKRVVPENGMAFVDAKGHAYAAFGKNDSGKGAQAMTSEYEIMRGDLVNIFYRASLGLDQDYGDDNNDDKKHDLKKENAVTSADGHVRYEFGVMVTSLSQHDDKGVDVTFSDGRKVRYDLVVGADGQWSRTRRMIFGYDNTNRDQGSGAITDPLFKSLGLFMGFYRLPRTDSDDGWMKWHIMPRKRGLFTRSADPRAPLQVYMALLSGTNSRKGEKEDRYGLRSALKQSVKVQKEAFIQAYADHHGWRVDELVQGLRDNVSDEEFYATEIGQVHCPDGKLAVGRVVLLGDAGYCPSPVTGMGTTLALTGAYILAGELTRRRGNDSGDGDHAPEALQAYTRVVKPFVVEGQKLMAGVPGILYAETSWGLWILTMCISLLSKLRIVDIVVRLMPENKGGLVIPEYPDLNLDA